MFVWETISSIPVGQYCGTKVRPLVAARLIHFVRKGGGVYSDDCHSVYEASGSFEGMLETS